MNYYKFVSWDAVELEKVKAGRVPLAIAAADRGDMKPLFMALSGVTMFLKLWRCKE